MATVKVPAHTRNGKKVKGYTYERKATGKKKLTKKALLRKIAGKREAWMDDPKSVAAVHRATKRKRNKSASYSAVRIQRTRQAAAHAQSMKKRRR